MTRLYTVDPIKPSATTHFDWLTFTIPVPVSEGQRLGQDVETYVYNVLAELTLNLIFSPMKHGIYTYDKSIVSSENSIIVGWYEPNHEGDLADDKAEFMVQISGQGVETLESILFKEGEVIADLVKKVINLKGHFTRVDACTNFFNYPKEYSARYVGEEAKKGNLVSKSSRVRLIHSFDAETGSKTDERAYTGDEEGFTTYIGMSPKQLRIYNKLHERREKVHLLYQVKSWSRWEFQLNAQHAQGFIDAYQARDFDLVQTWVDWLASNYRWIERVGHQAKKSRNPNATWYDKLIANAKDKIKVRSEKQMPTFERSEAWMSKQVYPTLASMYYARYKKYLQNGVLDEDAKKLAFKHVQDEIFDQIVNQNINLKRVEAWIKEREG